MGDTASASLSCGKRTRGYFLAGSTSLPVLLHGESLGTNSDRVLAFVTSKANGKRGHWDRSLYSPPAGSSRANKAALLRLLTLHHEEPFLEFLEAVKRAGAIRTLESLARIELASQGGALVERVTTTRTAKSGAITTTAVDALQVAELAIAAAADRG